MPGQARAQNVSPGGRNAPIWYRLRLNGRFFDLFPVLLLNASILFVHLLTLLTPYPQTVFSHVTRKEFSACPRNLHSASKKNFKW